MDLVLRGRRLSSEDLTLIQSLIQQHGRRGRYFLSRELCRLWNWIGPTGALKDAACRAVLLRLEDRGLVQLPRRIRGAARGPRAPQGTLALDFSEPLALDIPRPFAASLRWALAVSGAEARRYQSLVQAHHYLGYQREVGPVLRYVVYQGTRAVACLGWAAAAWKMAARDQFIGWSDTQRQRNLPLILNNTRFLVLPRTPQLASHLLGQIARRIVADWQTLQGYAPVLLETCVDTTRFKGTCYKAANWTPVGLTQGRGKWDRHTQRPETIKAVFLYPLVPDFRRRLTHE